MNMKVEQLEHIQAYIEKYNQDYPAAQYVYERDSDDYVYIFGNCFGIVLIPEIDGRITFTFLAEDDGYWFIKEDSIVSHNYWISDFIKCLTIAQEYLKENATESYFGGYKLPYKN